jgi:hypothetical protein
MSRLEERLAPPPPDEAQAHKRWNGVVARFCQLVDQATELLSEEEELSVLQALRGLTAPVDAGPYACWFRDLEDGSCRLPELPASVMKELLLAWLASGVTGGLTCKGCGLEYPHKNYRPVLAACPGCASPEWDWSHLVRDYDRAWKGLDGYSGGRARGSAASGGRSLR